MGTELEKLKKIVDESQKIGFFLDWLSSKNITLCQRHEHNKHCKTDDDTNFCGYREEECVPIFTSTEQLLADYFYIDLEKVEKEKQKILEDIRNEKS